jgi:ACR3 family arsenite transporter
VTDGSLGARGERHQIPLYVAAIVVGLLVGAFVPGSDHLATAIEPVLGALLFVTFLSVPLGRIRAGMRDTRFLVTLGILNFVVVPLVVFAVSRFVAAEPALLIGVLLVLLTPCVDYVVPFARLGGGASDRLLAATPFLLIAQMVLLPGYLWLFAGPAAASAIDPAPFLRAFLVLLVLPFTAALLVQSFAPRSRLLGRAERALPALMVPLMMLTLLVVVASQVGALGAHAARVLPLVPLYVGFAATMTALGALVARVARTDAAASRALVFSGVTRNSLVVLPLALALPAPLALAPLAVIAQTLVELVVMVGLVRLVPRIVPARQR